MKTIAGCLLLLLFAIATAACLENLPEVECTDVPSYGKVKAIDVCTRCHSSKLTPGARAGAPAGVDYNSYEDARDNATKGVEEVFEGSMPPGALSLSEDEKEAFYKWGLCGTPE